PWGRTRDGDLPVRLQHRRPARRVLVVAGHQVAMPASLASLVPASWSAALGPVLEAPGFRALEEFLALEEKVARVFPPGEQLFAALAHTPPAGVKVVIIGQDPYPTAGNANGLAFSVAPGVKIPASLRNI